MIPVKTHLCARPMMAMTNIIRIILKRIFCCLFISCAFVQCGDIYKAGNLIALSYPVETPLNLTLVQHYTDTLIMHAGYHVPEKWMHLDKLINLDSVNNKRLYFRNDPEEMYLISFQGMLILTDVYNPQLLPGDWISVRDRISPAEETRVKERFKKEILDVIEKMAKQNNVPDSILYFKPFR